MLLDPLSKFAERRETTSTTVCFVVSACYFLFARLANCFVSEVPFIHCDDASPSLVDYDVGDLFVLLGNARFRVQNQHGDVATGDGIFAPFCAKEFNGIRDASGLAQACRVDEQVALASSFGIDLKWHIDCVARSARNRTNDHALRLREGIDDGRLAHIGPAYDGQLQWFGRRLLTGFRICGSSGQVRDRGIEQGFDAFPVNGGYRKKLFKTERAEFRPLACEIPGIHFVDGDKDRFSPAAGLPCHILIERHEAFLNVPDEDDYMSGFNGQLDLIERGTGDDIDNFFTSAEPDTPGIHEREGVAARFCFSSNAIARHARLIVNNSDAPSDDSIEERGFPDVRSSNNGHKSRHVMNMEEPIQRRKVKRPIGRASALVDEGAKRSAQSKASLFGCSSNRVPARWIAASFVPPSIVKKW